MAQGDSSDLAVTREITHEKSISMDRSHLERTPYKSVELLIQKLFSNASSESEQAYVALRSFPDALVVCRVACRLLRKGKWQKRKQPGDYLIKLCLIMGEIGDRRCQQELLQSYRMFRENTALRKWSDYFAWAIVHIPNGRMFAIENLEQPEIELFFSSVEKVSLLINQSASEHESVNAWSALEQVTALCSGASRMRTRTEAAKGKAAASGNVRKSDQEERRKFTAANVKCFFGIHIWKGCVCSNCGQARDEEHNWSNNCEKCAVCGKFRTNAHNWSANCEKCAICGETRANAHNWSKNCEQCSLCRARRLNQHAWDGCRCHKCGVLNYDARSKLLEEISYGKRDLFDLSELIGCNIVTVSGFGISIEKVRLQITPKDISSSITVQIQPEFFVRAVDGNHQNMAIRGSTKVELQPLRAAWVVLDAVCINADRKVPTDRDRFEGVSRLSSDVRRYIEATQGKKPMVIQAGVWILTDHLRDFDLKRCLMRGGMFAISQSDIDEARGVLRSLGLS